MPISRFQPPHYYIPVTSHMRNPRKEDDIEVAAVPGISGIRSLLSDGSDRERRCDVSGPRGELPRCAMDEGYSWLC